jgi:hypothetical protein
MGKRQQRHHVVPRLHLRGFANSDDLLVQLDVTTGRRRTISISNAAVIRDFYTVVLPDGSRSDAWERGLSEIENEIAPALRRAIVMPHFDLTDDDRAVLARWIALQALRGPDSRRALNEVGAITTRMKVGMGGLAYLQHAMRRGLGRDVPLEEAEAVWDDITCHRGPEIVTPGDDHLQVLTRNVEKLTAMIYARSWARMRFTRRGLAVSDAPVTRVRGAGPDDLGVGLADAWALAVPLDRRTLLWLELPEGAGDPLVDTDLHPMTLLQRQHTGSAVMGAERFVYFHPDDDPVAIAPEGVEVPRPRRERMQTLSGPDMVNRDRPLDEVFDQIESGQRSHGDSMIADYTWPLHGYVPPPRLARTYGY